MGKLGMLAWAAMMACLASYKQASLLPAGR
jgi:hypothetical protein